MTIADLEALIGSPPEWLRTLVVGQLSPDAVTLLESADQRLTALQAGQAISDATEFGDSER